MKLVLQVSRFTYKCTHLFLIPLWLWIVTIDFSATYWLISNSSILKWDPNMIWYDISFLLHVSSSQKYISELLTRCRAWWLPTVSRIYMYVRLCHTRIPYNQFSAAGEFFFIVYTDRIHSQQEFRYMVPTTTELYNVSTNMFHRHLIRKNVISYNWK